MGTHVFQCIDAHTCGNPVRVVADGGPALDGADMAEKRQHFLAEYDWIRTGLMFEPRGHDMMSGSILYPPGDPDCDIGILFIETSGCLPMCGHGTIGTVTIMLEHGLVTPKTPGRLALETPAGRIDVAYTTEGKRVSSVKLTNVPSFLYATDLRVKSPTLGELKCDVAYGGNFYAIIEEQENYGGLDAFTATELVTMSPDIRTALNESYSFVHPEDARINGLSHLLWVGEPMQDGSSARNAVFYGDKAIDRSPCGTGTSSRMAQLAARGELTKDDTFIHESVIGSRFTGRIEGEAKVGEFDAIIPSIEGWARVTGFNTILIDDDDPYAHGFVVK